MKEESKIEDAFKPHKKTYDWLKQYQFQKGNNANPAGRPKGKSLKTFVREMFANMPEEDKAEYLTCLDPEMIWEMGEGKPKQDVEGNFKAEIKVVVPQQVADAFNIKPSESNTEAIGSNP